MVYVQNKEGKPLMPTQRHGKVRRMLRDGRAVVVLRTPFTIRLTYDTTNYVQDVTLGVDAGTAHIGLSATTEDRELYSAEATVRTDITRLLSGRREARRTRRGRKTRYRASRFDNRRKPEEWLAPSVRQKVQTHIRLIEDVRRILPVSKTVIEVAQFDTQLLRNPDIADDQYQQGEQTGFWNTREYVLYRDNHECQCCHGKSRDPVLNVHHIESRKTGGNSPDNLVTLCETCHRDYHAGRIKLDIKRRTNSLRDAAIMSIMRWNVYNEARKRWNDVHLTYGYITKNIRIRAGLEKSHSIDARCISGHPEASPATTTFLLKQIRRHNRQMHKAKILPGGRKKNNQAPRLVKGFRIFDKVRLGETECFIYGRRSSGSFDIRTIEGTTVNAGINCKKLEFLEISRSFLRTQRKGTDAIPPPSEGGSILAHFSKKRY